MSFYYYIKRKILAGSGFGLWIACFLCKHATISLSKQSLMSELEFPSCLCPHVSEDWQILLIDN